MAVQQRPSYKACITGIGSSQVGRALYREPLDLAVEGCLAAISDAGLERGDIDGLAAFVSGAGSPDAIALHEALGLNVEWYASSGLGPSQLGALFNAIMAVQTGMVRHALVFHASNEGSAHKLLGRGGALPGSADETPARVSGMREYWMPFGAVSAAHLISMYARRHMHEFGTTREQMGQIALVQRANAALTPHAIYTEPLSLEQYLAARMITEPFCLYDCDVPIDFCAAYVVSRRSAAGTSGHRPIGIEAIGTAMRGRPSWTEFGDLTGMILGDAAASLWDRTDLIPRDVDVAGLYDGFSWIAMAWLEALGFCGKGESGAFVEGGARISRDGELPINTDGGQMSAGRKHGWGYLAEVCTQLRGTAGERQVAANPSVGVLGVGGGVHAAALLLVRD